MIIFGRPEEGEKFQRRNEVFFRFWPRLVALLNRAFSRKFEIEKREDAVVFALGRLAVEDFMELLLLAGNGYGYGALRALRSCFELTVTCGYLANNPQLVQGFLDFHHVSERRALNHFRDLDVQPETFLSKEAIDRIEAEFVRVKPQFTESLCDKCDTKRIQPSWSKLDMASMAKKLGIGKFYPMMYFWPTMQSHATTYRLGPRFRETPEGFEFEPGPQPEEAHAAVTAGALAMAMLIDFQDRHFDLGLRGELEVLLTEYGQSIQPGRSTESAEG